MGSLQRAIRRAGQAALCASAVAVGAAASHLTSTTEVTDPEHGVFPPPMRGVARAMDARSARVAPEPSLEPALEPVLDPASEAPSPEPLGPFAERLRDGMVITGRSANRVLLFTFDDGPDPRNTPRLLDRLDEVGVKAVFFLTASRMSGAGPWAEQNRELAREIVRRGHIVGNHTLDHEQLPLLDDRGVVAQIEEADAIFERVLGARTWLLRPPGGSRSPRIDGIIASRGHTQLLWNVGTGDFQVRESADVVRTFRRVLERNEREGARGGVVLMHDTHAWSVDAFPQIVSFLRERNCELAEAGEELYDVVDDPSLFFTPRDAAHPSAEAPPAALDADTLAERQARVREVTLARCSRLAAR